MSDDIVENLKQPSQWFRVAFMVIFAVVLYVVGLVLTLLTVAQILFSLLTGSDNENLRALGKDLSTYVHQILAFLTYNSDSKPFPFTTYPSAEDAVTAAEQQESEVDLDIEVNIQEGSEPGSVAKPARAARKSAASKKFVPPAADAGETI